MDKRGLIQRSKRVVAAAAITGKRGRFPQVAPRWPPDGPKWEPPPFTSGHASLHGRAHL